MVEHERDEEFHRLRRAGLPVTYWARHRGDEPAVLSEDYGDRTFAELDRRANQLVRALRRRGVRAGDSVALLCRNRPEFAEVHTAMLRAGWRLTPVNWHLTAEEATYIVEDSEAVAVVADAGLGDRAQRAAALDAVRVRLSVDGPLEGFEEYEAALADEDDSELEDPVLGTVMLYTSGTTGRPKGVRRPQPRPPRRDTAGYRYGDRHLCTGPLYHAAPLAVSLVPPLTHGVGTVLMDGWDAEETLRLIEQHRITHTHMVPTMFHRLLALPEGIREGYDVSSLRFLLHGAAPCPAHEKRAIIEWFGPIVREYYSSTEGLACTVTSEEWLERPGTVGRPQPGHVHVGDEDGHPLPTGESGLVWIRAPEDNAFEYYKDSSKTESAYRNGYFTLGDLGYLDEDGYLYLTDRSAHLIISGGVNVYPAEVDAALLEHPTVGDVATIGIPDPEWGERVHAVVEPLGEPLDPEGLVAALLAHCRERLASFKCPRSIDLVDRLPRRPTGKVALAELRERYRAAATS